MSGNSFYGPLEDPAGDAGYDRAPDRGSASSPTRRCASAARRARWRARNGTRYPTTGSTCSGMSFDNTGSLSANSWRHVAFIEQPAAGVRWTSACLGSSARAMPRVPKRAQDFRWLMSSDVCKHCTHAGCLDVCPTGALFRTEFGTVVVQQDICNGCGYCVSGCPYGVIERREGDGRAWKCTMCYDRLHDGLGAGVCEGVPDGLDPVRPVGRVAGAGGAPCRAVARARGDRGAVVRPRPERRSGRRRRVLPAARRAGGVRAAAGPGGADAGCGRDVEVRGDGGIGVGRDCGVVVRGAEKLMSARAKRRRS